MKNGPAEARPTISLCMIVKDEEHDLPRCLRSAAPWVDEIVVVDTGSRDQTVQVAQSFGARVEHFSWSNDFAAARNAALAYATGDWILSLDADEELDPATAPALAKVVAVPITRPRCYALLVRSLDDSKDSLAYHSGYVTRLFVNHPQVRWHRPIHEQVVLLDDPRGIDLVHCDQVTISHYGYLHAARQGRGKATRNQDILRRAITATPNDSYLHFHLGLEHYHAHRYREAVTSFERVLELRRGKRLPAYLAPCYSLLVATHTALGQFDQAVASGYEGLEHFAFADLCCNLATAHMRRQEHDQAFDLYQRARALHGQRHAYPTDETATTSLPLQGMGDIHLLRGDAEQASRAYAEALEFQPESATLHKRAAQAFLLLDRPADAEQHIRKVLALEPDDGLTVKQLSDCLAAQSRHQEAYEFLAARVAAATDHVGYRLLLGDLLHTLGESDAATEVLMAGVGVGDDPAHAPIYYRLSQILAELGRAEDAANAAALAHHLDPEASAAFAVQEADAILQQFVG